MAATTGIRIKPIIINGTAKIGNEGVKCECEACDVSVCDEMGMFEVGVVVLDEEGWGMGMMLLVLLLLLLLEEEEEEALVLVSSVPAVSPPVSSEPVSEAPPFLPPLELDDVPLLPELEPELDEPPRAPEEEPDEEEPLLPPPPPPGILELLRFVRKGFRKERRRAD
ncbi:MAG: hypothetical protein M1836_002548 [Candelina mexicana]|nr:MAG: hypothetical protein M1836_002548 [Candelina mexicana]